MLIYTSVTANYLPKARVLASTIKQFHPEAVFHLVLSDAIPVGHEADLGLFDAVLTLADLGIPDVKAWTFQHSVVEMCTAVKGIAARVILERHGGGDLLYFDPDIAVLGPLDRLVRNLDRYPVLLTPHLTTPEEADMGIQDNEMCALQHGVYNLGFLGVRAPTGGNRFLSWWADRLLHYCFDDKPRGLFTDQRWVDLAPGFFPEVGILRDPFYNVATWNISHRHVAGDAPYDLTVNGLPICFYHFSGLDSGGQELMLARYGKNNPALWDLRNWYIKECERFGQSREGNTPCVYGFFDNGMIITKDHRVAYRHRDDLRRAFPDPYFTADPARSFYQWYLDYANNCGEKETADQAELRSLRARVTELERRLALSAVA